MKALINEFELFQIDQFLMKGKSLAIFYDAFNEMNMPQSQGRQQGPVFLPVSTGLEKMLDHYGVSITPSYVLDRSCFEQQMPPQYGGGKQAIYFAPIIKNEKINGDLDFMKYVKSLVMLKVSPITLREEALAQAGLRGDVIFSSSDESWEMSGRIDLSPWAMAPPEDPAEMESYDLAALISGEFTSYFAGKPVPDKPAPELEEADSTSAAGAAGGQGADLVTGEGAVVGKGRPGKIFLITSSEANNKKTQTQDTLFVVASDGGGWDHVSVSLLGRCPTWNEMSHVKNLFWDAEETVILGLFFGSITSFASAWCGSNGYWSCCGNTPLLFE